MAAAEKKCLVVQSAVKAFAAELGKRTAGDFAEGLSDKVEELITAAVQRCADNGRETLRTSDL